MHTVADAVDHAGSVTVRNDAGERQRAATKSGPRLDVGRVYAGPPQANAHLARARLGIGQIADDKHVARRPGPFVVRSLHPCLRSLEPSATWPADL